MSLLPSLIEINKSLQNFLHAGSRRNQIGNPEVVRAWALAESTSRHSHDSSLLHHVHAVHKVRLLALCLALVNEFLREVQPRESIHSALNFCARHIFHRVKRLSQDLRFLCKGALNSGNLTLIELDAFIRLAALLRRVDHELNGHLTDCVGAKLNALQLVEDCLRLCAHVVEFVVSTPESALAEHTLGH